MSWTEFHPLIQEAGRTTLAVSLLALLVLALRKPFARRFGAKAAYALWLLPLVRFAMPPLPANWSLSGWLGFASNAAPDPVAMQTITRTAPDTALFVPEMLAAPPPVVEMTIAAPNSASLMGAVLAQMPIILVSLWVTGTVLWLGRSIYQQRQFLQLIRDDSEPASAAMQSAMLQMARQLGLKSPPAIRQSLLCSGPLVTGLVNPVILLPMWFEDDYTADEQRDAIVHELTHIRRRDLWAFQIARLVAATQWFNPLVYMALKAFRTDQESACDADVLNQDQISPAAYGRTLVKAARLARPSDRKIAAASLTLAHPIKERLIMMQHPIPTLRSRLLGTTIAATIGAAALFATASCASSALADEPESETFVWSSHSEADDNRQMVLLSDPFSELHPKFIALGEMDFDDFDVEFNFEMAELELEMQDLQASLSGLESLEGLAELELLTSAADGIFIMKDGELPADFEIRIEKWAEEVEKQAEQIEEQAELLEERNQEIQIRLVRKAEAISEGHEARRKSWALKMEQEFDQDFEANIEAATEAVESLAEQCEARGEDDPTPEIVSAVDAESGETYRALCVNGERDVLKSDSLADWVQGRSDLSDAEKSTFMQNRSQHKRVEVIRSGVSAFHLDDDGPTRVIVKSTGGGAGAHRIIGRTIAIERPEMPEAPEAPEAPAQPELDGSDD